MTPVTTPSGTNKSTGRTIDKNSSSNKLARNFVLSLLAFGVGTILLSGNHVKLLDETLSTSAIARSETNSALNALSTFMNPLANAEAEHYPRFSSSVGGSAKGAVLPPPKHLPLSGLSCDRFNGPPAEDAKELVYWEDIPSDSKYVSPFKVTDGSTQYLTFEPDTGGWNNIRMAMETVIVMGFAMGRTVVLPPEKKMYLLGKKSAVDGKEQKATFSFNDFFPMDAISKEHDGVDIISMEQFLTMEQNNFVNVHTGEKSSIPGGVLKWDGRSDIDGLFQWLRTVSVVAAWSSEECVAAFPATSGKTDIQQLQNMEATIQQSKPSVEEFVGKPVPVDGTPIERLRENWAERKNLCIYDEHLQSSSHVHFKNDRKTSRLLVHFYAFIYFQDYRIDLWAKRFVRDHFRYADEIQCAAARIIKALRERARASPHNDPNGEYDAFHVRRGELQFPLVAHFPAEEQLKMAQRNIPDGSLLYIATDEQEKSFFDPLKTKYDVVFMDDFMEEALAGVNSNYFGMIDQLVASRSRTFYGCWFSTFSGYIFRLRGYHADEEQQPGYEDGILPTSWYYALPDRYDHMQKYYPVKKSFFAREFPTGWRNIDFTLDLGVNTAHASANGR